MMKDPVFGTVIAAPHVPIITGASVTPLKCSLAPSLVVTECCDDAGARVKTPTSPGALSGESSHV